VARLAKQGLRLRSLVSAALALLAVALWSPVALAHQGAKLEILKRVSAVPHLPTHCLNPHGGPANVEVNTSVAADQSQPRHLAISWYVRQKRNSNDHRYNARAVVIASSRDGGHSWHRSLQPGVDSCTGRPNYYQSGGHDPWLSFGPGGRRLYLVSQAGKPGGVDEGGAESLWSSWSTDDGRTWHRSRSPMRGSPRFGIPDEARISVHPHQPQRIYVISQVSDPLRYTLGNTVTGKAYLTRSRDFGRSWSRPQLVYAPAAGAFRAPHHNSLFVLGKHTLLNVFDEYNGSGFVPGPDVPALVEAVRSTDGGRTWSQPSLIAAHGPGGIVSDQEGENEMVMQTTTSSAMAPDGTVYVAWQDPVTTGPPQSTVNVARSEDGGRTWSSPQPVSSSSTAYQPTIAIADDGTLGVTWYDTRRDVPGDDAWSADVYFAYSADGGRYWTERQIAGPMNLRSVKPSFGSVGPEAVGELPAQLGFYFGMAGLRRGFAAAFVVSKPLAEDGATDVWFAKLATG
jgi:hypothetical protein